MRQNLNRKFVAVPERILGGSAHPNTCGGASDNDSSRGKCSALGQPADNFRDRKDEVAE